MARRPTIKQAWEDGPFTCPFKDRIPAGRALASVVEVLQAKQGKVSGSADLTLGTKTFSGTDAQVRISGGTAGEDYKLTFRVTDDQGGKWEADAWLSVRD